MVSGGGAEVVRLLARETKLALIINVILIRFKIRVLISRYLVMDLLYWLLTAIVVGLVLAFVFDLPRALYSFYIKWKAVRNIPGLPTHWLWGNLHQMRLMFQHEEETMKFIKYVCENRFKVAVLCIGPFRPALSVHHCSLVGKVLKLPKNKELY